jgi:hypothetical protein
MARPRLAYGEKRDEVLGLRITPAERAEIEDQAERLGISPADFMRRRVLGYRLPPLSDEAKARASLALAFNRVGVNMNQIAHRLNAGGEASEVEVQLLAMIEQLKAELANLHNGPGSDQGGPQL